MTENLKVEARGVWKSFKKNPVLRNVSLNLVPGDIMALIGPSGAGKTTFLRCINHLEVIDRGYIAVDGEMIGYRMLEDHRLSIVPNKKLSAQRARVGMVFQEFNLFRHMTAIENVMFAPMNVKGRSRAEARTHALALLTKMGLEAKINSHPAELSGGQQQRVAIARALAMDPTLLLLDEPTSALDTELAAEVRLVISAMAAEGRSMLVATHDLSLVRDVAKKVVFMTGGEIIEQGSPQQILDNPRHPRIIQFLSTISSPRSGIGD